jgi:hypothetical protein
VTADRFVDGLAAMLEELVRRNLERDPARGGLLRRPLRAVIEVPDAGVRASLGIDADRTVHVHAGDDAGARIRVRADAADVLALASVPLWGGFPDVRTREGRAVVRDLVTGAIRVRGLLRHPGDVSRLTRLLSTA